MKQTKDFSDAEQHFLSALDINPKYVDCILEMAILQLDMDQKKKAQKFYHKARTISPGIKHAVLDKMLT